MQHDHSDELQAPHNSSVGGGQAARVNPGGFREAAIDVAAVVRAFASQRGLQGAPSEFNARWLKHLSILPIRSPTGGAWPGLRIAYNTRIEGLIPEQGGWPLDRSPQAEQIVDASATERALGDDMYDVIEDLNDLAMVMIDFNDHYRSAVDVWKGAVGRAVYYDVGFHADTTALQQAEVALRLGAVLKAHELVAGFHIQPTPAPAARPRTAYPAVVSPDQAIGGASGGAAMLQFDDDL